MEGRGIPIIQLLITLPYMPNYSQFCVKIPKFSLPWQQGRSLVNLNDAIKLRALRTPCSAQNVLLGLYLSGQRSYSHIFVKITEFSLP